MQSLGLGRRDVTTSVMSLWSDLMFKRTRPTTLSRQRAADTAAVGTLGRMYGALMDHGDHELVRC